MFLSLVSAISTKFIIPDKNRDFDFTARAYFGHVPEPLLK